jgi:hypothetical protein
VRDAWRFRTVFLVCGTAILLIEALGALGLHYGLANAEAFRSLTYVMYLVTGVGAGRLAVSDGVRNALWLGALAGGFAGLVATIVRVSLWWMLGVAPPGMAPGPWPGMGSLLMAVVTIATAAVMGVLGGIAGWGIRRAVEP